MMKLLYLFLLIVPFGQKTLPPADPIDKAADLLKSGNITELSKMFATSVDITLLDENDTYSSVQAAMVLEKFFRANPVKSVKILHRVSSNPTVKFAVMILTTGSGSYRTSLSLKLTNNQFLLNEIRIEAEKE